MDTTSHPKITVSPSHIIDKEEGDIFGVGSQPYGNRFLRLRDNQVTIFDTWRELESFSIDSKSIHLGEVHPRKDIVAICCDSNIDFLDFSGRLIHSFNINQPHPNAGETFGFEDSGAFFWFDFIQTENGDKFCLRTWPANTSTESLGNRNFSTDETTYHVNLIELKETKPPGWRSAVIGDYQGFGLSLFRTVNGKIELGFGEPWDGEYRSVAFSIDGSEVITAENFTSKEKGERISGIRLTKKALSTRKPSTANLTVSLYDDWTEDGTNLDKGTYLDLVHAIFLSEGQEIIPIIHTRSMSVEGLLVIEGFESDGSLSGQQENTIKEISRCGDYLRAVTPSTIVFVEIEKIMSNLSKN